MAPETIKLDSIETEDVLMVYLRSVHESFSFTLFDIYLEVNM